MTNLEFLIEVNRLLHKAHQRVTRQKMQETLGCSSATVDRAIKDLRKRFDAPIKHSRDYPPGYYYSDPTYVFLGHRMSTKEMQSLLVIDQMLRGFGPGLLDDALKPVARKFTDILRSMGIPADSCLLVRLLHPVTRPPGPCFDTVAAAVFQRKRLDMAYYALPTGKTSQRIVSPQRLVTYRGMWYLDAWCHNQEGLRMFAVDCINPATLLEEPAIKLPKHQLDRILGSSYGIFSGEPTAIARLLFTPYRARWISREIWHPDQVGRFLKTGEYLLEIPYNRADELILDIMRYGPDVKVLDPPELRDAVAERLRAAADQYK